MSNNEIIARAVRIVRGKLEDINDTNADSIEMSKEELSNVSAALVLAAVLCRANGADCEGGRFMSLEQKQLLYEIAKWRSDKFYNAMNDHWDSGDYAFDRECTRKIKELEEQYKNLYGDLPEWKYIDDVLATMKELEVELQ